jgi:CRISPR-associated protein Cmr2
VDKRSGASREVAGKWGELDNRLLTFAGWHVADEVPNGAAFQLRDIALRLAGVSPPPNEDREVLDLAGRYEAIRILGRKRVGGGSRVMENNVLSFLSKLLLAEDSMPGLLSVAALADELIVARVFAEAAATSGAGRKEAGHDH